MKIAISGSHHVGKSTLITDFLKQKPSYQHLEEPYELLEEIDQDFSIESMLEQLKLSLEMIDDNSHEEKLIFERCPADFVAYLLYLKQHQEAEFVDEEIDRYQEKITDALAELDLIIYLPLGTAHDIDYHEEDFEARSNVDVILKEIYQGDFLDLLAETGTPRIVEITGDQRARLNKLLKCINC